ncbi:hypothetical protein [Nonomuraea glycinis]|uniref:hypothetical protein n=1 Tax=Nonomuraea glycinis TaxID=2047744 RepID=UPI002E12C547|nr:hypothetical protein OHA68_20980 [Nonomuraea glycinis]
MADVGDQDQTHDAPTAPFRKIVLPPTDETITFPKVQPGAVPHPTPDTEPKPVTTGPKAVPPTPRSGPTRQTPAAEPGSARQAPAAESGSAGQTPEVEPGFARQAPKAEPLPGSARPAGPPVFPEQGAPALPPFPPPPPPPKGGLLSRIGDIPIKVIYLLGAILATVLAVVLVFVIFPGEVPGRPEGEPVVPVQPVPSAVSASVPPSGGAPVAVPAAPAKQAFAQLPGKASVVSGTIVDQAGGISYPRLGEPWSARSYAPFSIAQRAGKVAVPQTVIASAPLPGAIETKPSKDADYRALAVRAARWTLRTQYPKGATLAWAGSQKTPEAKGWTLGFKVTYTLAGKRQEGRALVSVLEAGKTKPTMLVASIPATGKAYWADLNTLVTKVRPL